MSEAIFSGQEIASSLYASRDDRKEEDISMSEIVEKVETRKPTQIPETQAEPQKPG